MLITISHDRHFLNSICTHIADIDYETIITYTGGYDDMVRQKSQLRSRVEPENAEKQKKISQLQGLRGSLLAPARAPPRCRAERISWKKLKLEDLKRSNIARPFIVRAESPQRETDPHPHRPHQVLGRPAGHPSLLRPRHQGREDLRHREERHGQVYLGAHAGRGHPA